MSMAGSYTPSCCGGGTRQMPCALSRRLTAEALGGSPANKSCTPLDSRMLACGREGTLSVGQDAEMIKSACSYLHSPCYTGSFIQAGPLLAICRAVDICGVYGHADVANDEAKKETERCRLPRTLRTPGHETETENRPPYQGPESAGRSCINVRDKPEAKGMPGSESALLASLQTNLTCYMTHADGVSMHT